MAGPGAWSDGQAAAVLDTLAAYWPGQSPAGDSAAWRVWRTFLARRLPAGAVLDALDDLRWDLEMPGLDRVVAVAECRRGTRAGA